MIFKRTTTSVFRLSQRTPLIKYNYVTQKGINDYITEKQVDRSTTFGTMKYYFYFVRYIMLEGFKEAKDDVKWMSQTTKDQSMSPEEVERYYRVKRNFGKLAIPFLLNLLPFGNLFIILMMRYSPETLPSWFQIYEQEIQRRKAYQQTKQFINKKFDISGIDFKTANVQDLKLLSLALTGRIVDGTIVLNRMFGQQYTFQSGPLSYLSAWMIRSHIKRHLKYQTRFYSLPDKSVEEKIDMIVGRK